MNRTDTILVGVSLFIFLASPFLPTTLYTLAFTNMFVPFLMLLLVLYLVKTSPIGSVTVLLAIMSLFIEYRYRVLATSVPRSVDPPAEYEKQLAPAPPIMPDEIHPPPRRPSDNRVTYKPSADATDEFDAVGRSVNSKTALPGVRLPEETNQYLIEHNLVPNVVN